MKLKSAISKLQKHGYRVTPAKNRSSSYSATKGNITICYDTFQDPIHKIETLTNIAFTRDAMNWCRCDNLSKTLRILGDLPDNFANNTKKSQDELIKLFVKNGEGALSIDQIKSLNIRSKQQLTKIFASLFPLRKISARQPSKATRVKEHFIERRKSELWDAAVQIFLGSDPNAMPLRKVEITARIDTDDVVRDRWGMVVSNEVKCIAPVFARTAACARETVKSLLGDFADALDLGIVVIGPQESALEVYNADVCPKSAQESLKREIDLANSSIEEAKNRLKQAELVAAHLEKKIKLAKFLDGFGTLATMSSQGDEVTGQELN